MKPTLKASGRFVLRVSPQLHLTLKSRAARTRTSLNEICVNLLSNSLREKSTFEQSLIPQALLEKLKSKWSSALKGLALFGSAARGEQTENSDVDLLIALDHRVELSRELYQGWDQMILELGDSNLKVISPHFVHLPESIHRIGSLWLEVALDGKIIFESSAKLSSLLQAVRQKIAEGDWQKKYSHGHPYWVSVKNRSLESQ